MNYLKSNPTILNEARNYIDGLILSDGYIKNGSPKASLYVQKCKHKEWLDVISKYLKEQKIECTISNRTFHTTGFCKTGTSYYQLHTYRYIEFEQLRNKWYKKWYNIDNYPETLWHLDNESDEYFIWKKTIPKDVCLNPECVANLYIGDGSISKHKGHYYISLSTQGFLKEDIIFLSDSLSELLDIKFTISKKEVIRTFSNKNTSIFLNYIRDYKVDCYSYKFPDHLL